MKQYCITGVNRLTRERQVITTPCSLSNAISILKREKAKSPKKREWIRLKINVYPVAPEIIPFKNE